MELEHTFTVPASAERTWALLTDLHQVGSCFPGATVTEADTDSFSGTVKVKLGPIAMVYSGSGHFVDRDDTAHRATIEATGKDKRGNGTAGATVQLQLQPAGEQTEVQVRTDLSITGKPAQFGRGVMQDVSDKLLDRFVDCLENTLQAPAEEAAEESSTATPGGPAPVTLDAPAADEPPTVSDDDPIDLGGAVATVLLQRYAPAVAALGGVLLGYLLGRRGRH